MTDKTEYAIGGPTVELLFNSYNNKYNTKYLAKAVSVAGYQISKDNGENWDIMYDEMLNGNDDLYAIAELYKKTQGMWLASPSGDTTANNRVMLAGNTGGVGRTTYGTTAIGFRPVICLNSDVKLEKQADGSYHVN